MKRLFDIIFSFMGFLIGSPFFLLICLLILFSSKGNCFYSQVRVGKDGKLFKLLKFRTMRPGSDKAGQLTVGTRDPRITRLGYFLRKYKLDELPQLVNILKGEMSVVGPRPEVPEYVTLYNQEQLTVLSVKPGLTDYASLAYINENDILGKTADPQKAYVEDIMPAKLKLNLQYIRDRSFLRDIQLIFRTLRKIG